MVMKYHHRKEDVMSDGTSNASMDPLTSMQTVIGRVVDVRPESPRSRLHSAHVDVGAADLLRFSSSRLPNFRSGDLVVVQVLPAGEGPPLDRAWVSGAQPSRMLCTAASWSGPAAEVPFDVAVVTDEYSMGDVLPGRPSGASTNPVQSAASCDRPMLIVSSVPTLAGGTSIGL
jgi:hypothetical protein